VRHGWFCLPRFPELIRGRSHAGWFDAPDVCIPGHPHRVSQVVRGARGEPRSEAGSLANWSRRTTYRAGAGSMNAGATVMTWASGSPSWATNTCDVSPKRPISFDVM